MNSKHDDLLKTEELFDFLQGTIPEGYSINRKAIPRLTPDQAWTVIWYLGEQHWEVTDYIERCDVCGFLYNSEAEGGCLDYGKAPCNFCDQCMASDEYNRKAKSKLNPTPPQIGS